MTSSVYQSGPIQNLLPINLPSHSLHTIACANATHYLGQWDNNSPLFGVDSSNLFPYGSVENLDKSEEFLTKPKFFTLEEFSFVRNSFYSRINFKICLKSLILGSALPRHSFYLNRNSFNLQHAEPFYVVNQSSHDRFKIDFNFSSVSCSFWHFWKDSPPSTCCCWVHASHELCKRLIRRLGVAIATRDYRKIKLAASFFDTPLRQAIKKLWGLKLH